MKLYDKIEIVVNFKKKNATAICKGSFLNGKKSLAAFTYT